MTLIFGVDAGNIASSGFPPALVARVIGSMLKLADRPRDPAARAEAEALGADMARHQGEHRALAALKQVQSRPGRIDLAALAKDSTSAPLSGGLATEPDRESVRLVAPEWIAVGSKWELPGGSTSGWSAGEARPPLAVVVGPDRTAVVPASFAIALLTSWASARAEPGDAGASYRARDSIADARAAAAGVFAQDDRRPAADQREGTNVRDDRPGARVPSSLDRRPGGDPWGEDHRR